MSSAPVVRAQSPDSLPPGVTPAAVEKGRKIYGGPGLCFACHGPEGKGGIGPDLTDRAWLHHDGDYQTLVKQITDGITAAQSKGGQIMPPRGGSVINDAEVLAVAAYVWTLSRRASSSP
jgi:cytochrome c oxidase cbb3-type subunit 3